MQRTPQPVANAYLKDVCEFQKTHAKYLMRGKFVDDDGFTCSGNGLVAKRFVADDGTSAVSVWNISEKPLAVEIDGLGKPKGVFAPGSEKADGTLAPDSIRLYVY